MKHRKSNNEQPLLISLPFLHYNESSQIGKPAIYKFNKSLIVCAFVIEIRNMLNHL